MSLPRAEEWTDPGSMDPLPRRRRKLLRPALVTIAAVAGSLLVWRAASLSGIPDIGPPFDTKALGTVALPDELNAFTYYRQAVAKYHDERLAGPYLSWAQAPQRHKEWLFANGEAMELWLVGTTMDRALNRQPKDSRLATDLDVVQTLRRIGWLDQLVGLRMEGVGELEEAWGWYRAGLRCSRHCMVHGSFRARLVGIVMFRVLAGSVLSWADHPNQSPTDLRRTLDDLVAIDAMTPSFRENLQAEYFAYEAMLNDPGLSARKIFEDYAETDLKTRLPSPLERLEEGAWRLVLREPERSRRVLHLVWANWLSVADLPAAERMTRGHKHAHGYFYDPPADAPAAIRRLTPERLDRWVASTRYLRALLPAIENIELGDARDEAARASLIVSLAEALYTRENGHRPESPERLVGPYLRALPAGYKP